MDATLVASSISPAPSRSCCGASIWCRAGCSAPSAPTCGVSCPGARQPRQGGGGRARRDRRPSKQHRDRPDDRLVRGQRLRRARSRARGHARARMWARRSSCRRSRSNLAAFSAAAAGGRRDVPGGRDADARHRPRRHRARAHADRARRRLLEIVTPYEDVPSLRILMGGDRDRPADLDGCSARCSPGPRIRAWRWCCS